MNFVATGWLLGGQRADLVLALQVFINLLNIALDLLLGVVMGWGLVGVAWATVVAEVTGSGLSLVLTARIAARRGAPFQLAAVRDLQAFRRIASVNTTFSSAPSCRFARSPRSRRSAPAWANWSFAANGI